VITQSNIIVGDSLTVMRHMEANSVDLVITSPPYEDARTYGIGFSLKGQDWVDWCVERYLECTRISRGLVAWVVEGRTRQFRWSATPALLMADLHRAGVKLRKPPVFARVGIPGSGGSDWWRNDYEFVICSSKGKLPWSDAAACGHVPKYRPGGPMSNRTSSGSRVTTEKPSYSAPKLANPGNIVRCKVGGGLMGHPLAHENEAPFPESLVDRFIVSFCRPGGMVFDPFVGSGTTIAVAKKRGRDGIGVELRKEQAIIARRRIADVKFESTTVERKL
jgi:hypothetical protein